ncbi:MAG: hypothetical protein GY832_10770 [Chloroflexi bacterium]|nr:hypothetical protein [Chloroflexota bacterium]
MHYLDRTGGDGEGADHTITDQQERLNVHLGALANGGAWIDNGVALHLGSFFHILCFGDQSSVVGPTYRKYVISLIHVGDKRLIFRTIRAIIVAR